MAQVCVNDTAATQTEQLFRSISEIRQLFGKLNPQQVSRECSEPECQERKDCKQEIVGDARQNNKLSHRVDKPQQGKFLLARKIFFLAFGSKK